MYLIKSVFATLQGEGINAGRRACFVRFAGCNMWSGHPGDSRNKGKGACAKWCDTEFRNGERMSVEELETAMDMAYPVVNGGERLCVLTGGEPGLQLDIALFTHLHEKGWEVAVETNGTVDPQEDGDSVMAYADHIAVSPKLLADGTPPKLALRVGQHDSIELKVVLPGHVNPTLGWKRSDLIELSKLAWDEMYVQPMDPIDPAFVEVSALKSGYDDHGLLSACVSHCLDFVAANPNWRVGLQQHKFLGLD